MAMEHFAERLVRFSLVVVLIVVCVWMPGPAGVVRADADVALSSGPRPAVWPDMLAIVMPDVIGDSGGELVVPVDLVLCDGLDVLGIEVSLSWDASVLSIEDVSTGAATSGWLVAANTSTPGVTHLALAGTSAVESSGAVADLSFRVIGKPGQVSVLHVDHAEVNEGQIGAAVSDGSVTVKGADEVVISLALCEGWNLISLPIVPSFDSMSAFAELLGSDCGLVYTYAAGDNGGVWTSFNPAAPPVSQGAKALAPGAAMWVYMARARDVQVLGTLPQSTAMKLAPGWNLIGYPSNDAQPVVSALSSLAGSYDHVYGLDASVPGGAWMHYSPSAVPGTNSLEQLNPGLGYWIHMTSGATLTLE